MTVDQSIQERTDAVKALLKASESDENHAKLQHIEKLERRAKMSFEDQLADMAKDAEEAYADDKFNQRFDCLKDIKAVDGFITLVADEHKAMKNAMDKAVAVLGEHTPASELIDYAEKHAVKTTVMSVRNFENHLRLVLMMVAQAPEYFGYGKGGTELRDIIDRSKAAIEEARRWFEKNNNTIKPDLYKALCSDDLVCSDEQKLGILLGENWRDLVKSNDNIHALNALLS